MDGVSEGDFTMVMGYPGSTDRFLSSCIDQALRLYNHPWWTFATSN